LVVGAGWLRVPGGVPAAGSAEDRLKSLLRFAVLAPSDRNTQPWIFRVEGDALELEADETRRMPHGDPDGRTLTISCGAALYYLRLAARHYGYVAAVERLPDAGRPRLLARVRLEPGPAPSKPEEALFDAIPDRRTNRRSFHEGFVPPYLVAQLEAAAAEEGAWLAIEAVRERREALAELIAEGDRIRMADPALREERAAWIRRPGRDTHDGLPAHAFGMPEPLDFATSLVAAVVRHDDRGNAQAFVDTERATGPGLLVILGTFADTPTDWLRAGEALAHVLLRATAAGLSASFLNSPIEVPALRRRVALAAGRPGEPQLLMRLGYGPEVPPTPRRGVDEVVS
jgi:hypothetical protein